MLRAHVEVFISNKSQKHCCPTPKKEKKNHEYPPGTRPLTLLSGQMGWRMTNGRPVPVVHVLKYVLWMVPIVALLTVVFQMDCM